MNLISERSDKALIKKNTLTYLLVVAFILLMKVGLKAQEPPFETDCERTILTFDGTDDYLDVQGTTINGNAGTWEAWVRKDNWTSQTNGILFGNDIAFNATNSMYFSFHSAVGLHFRYGDTSNEPTTGGAIYGQFTNGFAAHSWHHLAVTWEHNSGTTTLKMFVDGVEQSGFAAGSRTTHNALIDPGSSLNFGFSQGENYLEAGALAEVRTWDIARTESQIQSTMNTTLSGTESGLTGYWPLNDMTGTVAVSNEVSGAAAANLTNSDANTAWETLTNVKATISQEGTVIANEDLFDFGIVESGQSLTKTFTITNQGATSLSLNGSPAIVVNGVDAAEMVADASSTATTLAAGASTTFDLIFAAGATGNKSASFNIASDDICLPLFEVNLTGQSVVTTRPDAIMVSNANPCLNETITLSVDGGNIFGDAEWVWYEGSESGTQVGTGASIDVVPQRSGRYLVRAEEAGTPLTGFTTSPTIALSSATAITIDQQPSNSVVALGNAHSLAVLATGSGISYQWQKDGTDLMDGGNISGAQTAQLNFAMITAADDATYRCVVSNYCAMQVSAEVNLVSTSGAYVTLPLLEDFESTDGSFTSSNLKGPTTWEHGTSAGGANSGTEVWETDLDGIIQNNEINVLISPSYVLSPELDGAELEFKLNYDLTLFQQSGTPVTDRWFQGAELNITTDGGANWSKINDFEEGGYSRSSGFIFNDANLDWPLWTDNSGGWITARVNLADYVGQEVQFRFIVSTTSGFAGWFFGSGMKIDDWGITELDNTAPGAAFEMTDGLAGNTAVQVQVNFTEEVIFALTDLEVTNGSLSNLQTSDNQVFTFDVTPTSNGFVTIGIDEAANLIEDLSGNGLANSPELTFFSDASSPDVFVYVEEGPVFSTFTADVVFTKSVSNFELSDISATNANLSNLQTIDNISYTVDVAPTTTGLVSLSVAGLVAEDQLGNQNNASEIVSLDFNPSSAPTLDPIGDQTVDEQTELSFTVNATDLNQGETITYSLDASSLGKGMSIDESTGAFSWTPTEFQDGEHTVTITVTDDGAGALSDDETISITVNEVNQNPSVTIGPAVWNIPEDAYASRSYQIEDPDGHSVNISLDDDAVALGFGLLDVFNPVVNKLVFWTAPEEVEVATFDVTVTVTDDFGGSTEFVITINIQEVNQLPVLNAIGDQSTDELTELAFTISGSDADLPTQALSYSISDGLLAGMSLDSETGAFSWTPTETQDGEHTVTFAISDDFTPDAGVATETITITVNETNQSPVLSAIADQAVDERAELVFTVSA
ncbi:MAG: putative Ig domain-containing protein, partial [Bacteroidota bacterium]